MNTVTTKHIESGIEVTFKSGANNFIDNVIRSVEKLAQEGYECHVMDMGKTFTVSVY